MPESIRLKVGGVSSTRFSVYDEFARNIPGFQAMSEREAALFIPKSAMPVSFHTQHLYIFDQRLPLKHTHLSSRIFLTTLLTNSLFI